MKFLTDYSNLLKSYSKMKQKNKRIGNLLGATLIACLMGASSNVVMAQTNSSDNPSTPVTQNSASKPASVKVVFTGDIMMGTTYPDSINGSNLPPNDGRDLFVDVKEVIAGADFAGGNLEGNLLDGPGKRRKMGNPKYYFVFRMPTRYVDHLVDAGYDFLGIANNHTNDFGKPGQTSTMETLEKAGLAYAGLKGICETAYVERDGVKYGVAQVGHGGNSLDVTNISEVTRLVKELRKNADIVILSFHGGAEGQAYTHVPSKTERYLGENRGNVRALAHAAIDAGADAVFGHGPHVARGAELYKDHIIFYSLGNFCTPYIMNLKGISGQAPIAEVELDMDGKFIGGKIHSFYQKEGEGPRLDPTNGAAQQIRKLSLEDFPESTLIIADDGRLSKK